ncbi:MAG: polymerase subunit beta [Caloramator sp.]|jgi:DNA polymerase-3 subunit beta|uniref:DNA polymerase III subunit beta n=1 Tax=Caloramator sp. TaxID=1871330 RepID=UPI001DF6118C|nr:DNA polymerase III subunit beta [Caloramator sp.]MBZ4662514.1 polymerase subunit beta [Caloramator sp.]
MWFICEKELLQEAINTVQKATSTKTTYPILEGIHIRATKDNKVTFTATDLDLGIETFIETEVYQEGATVVNSKLFGEFIRKLPNDKIIIKMENNNVYITCQKSEFVLLGNNPDEFPKLPTINENSMYEISQDLIKSMIRSTIFAIAQEETRPILTGVLFEVKDGKLSFVALDGYRLALKRYDIDSENEISAVIPGKTLNEISKILETTDEKAKITFTPNHILFNLGNTKVISRLLDGEFINYSQIIPEEYRLKVKVNRNELLDSIERASLLAREGKTNLIKFDIKDSNMIITSNSQLGKVYEEVNIELEGENLKIAFNSKYFLDVLRIIDSDEIYLEFTTNVSPCVVKKCNSDDYIYLVLPVRLVEE